MEAGAESQLGALDLTVAANVAFEMLGARPISARFATASKVIGEVEASKFVACSAHAGTVLSLSRESGFVRHGPTT